MVSLIVWLICLLIVVLIVRAIVDALGLQPPVARNVWLVLALIFLVVLSAYVEFSQAFYRLRKSIKRGFQYAKQRLLHR